MATKKKKSAKRKGPMTVAELKAKPQAKAKGKSEPKKKAAMTAKGSAQNAYRFVSENLKTAKKAAASSSKMSVIDSVQDRLLSLLLEAFEKQHGTPGGNKNDFKAMRREWLRKRLTGMVPMEKLEAIRKRLRTKKRGNA